MAENIGGNAKKAVGTITPTETRENSGVKVSFCTIEVANQFQALEQTGEVPRSGKVLRYKKSSPGHSAAGRSEQWCHHPEAYQDRL